MTMKQFSKFIICIIVFTINVIGAGLNPNAVISLDLDPSTSAVDTNFVANTDSAIFSIALRIDQIVSLKGYSVKFNIDTNKLKFEKFVLNDNYNSNILGLNPMNFNDDSDTSIEVVVSSGTPVTAANGYLGTISFKSRIKTGQSITLKTSYAEITDATNALDQVNNLNSCNYKVEPLTHKLTLVSGLNGVISSPSGGEISVVHNTPVAVVATANPGYVFLKWELESASDGVIADPLLATTTVSITKDTKLTAVFDAFTKTIFPKSSDNVNRLFWRYTDGKLWLNHNGNNHKITSVNLLDLKGRTVKLQSIENNGCYDYGKLPTGKYVVTANDGYCLQNSVIMVP
jgi:hypothetical protein